nr:lck-interacting transmembrane adapter 1 [Loxodonta africana]
MRELAGNYGPVGTVRGGLGHGAGAQGRAGQDSPRPASMDLLHPHWLEGYRGTPRPPAVPPTFPHQELPRPLPVFAALASTGPEATYSNVGLAALPRVSLAARPTAAEYACIQKLKGTDKGPQGQQGKAEVTSATQVDILYSRVNKPKRRDAGPTKEWPDSEGSGSSLAPLQMGQGVDHNPLENVYESIQEMCPSS